MPTTTTFPEETQSPELKASCVCGEETKKESVQATAIASPIQISNSSRELSRGVGSGGRPPRTGCPFPKWPNLDPGSETVLPRSGGIREIDLELGKVLD